MSATDYLDFNRQLWDQLAEPWERRREWHEPIVEPITNWLLGRLRPQQGETVLELAAGNGETGLRAATALGDRGRLVLTDLAPAMVATARRRGEQLGLTNVEYAVMHAEELDLPDSSVDAVVCRYVYMLMPDRERALAETARVLRPGGRLCFAFASPAENQFFIVPGSVLIERGHFQPDPAGRTCSRCPIPSSSRSCSPALALISPRSNGSKRRIDSRTRATSGAGSPRLPGRSRQQSEIYARPSVDPSERRSNKGPSRSAEPTAATSCRARRCSYQRSKAGGGYGRPSAPLGPQPQARRTRESPVCRW